MNILLVDDDRVDREIINRALRKSELKVNVTEAETVDEGLKHYNDEIFDIILLDYRMPQRDGIEMILELRNEPKDMSIAIVMMSSSENENLALECLRAGAQDFLVKSDITASRLRRAMLHAQTRFDLEKKLFISYQKVKSLAETDTLTGLANRYCFDESLKLSIINNSRNGQKLALVLIDLDNFKYVNDSFGHDMGDLLLKKVVTRVKSCLRGNELFARLGGDEFAIILNDIEFIAHSSLVAQRVLKVLEKPFEISTTNVKTGASIGISVFPENGKNSEDLFKRADIAMYRAKKNGKNQLCFYQKEMQLQFDHRVEIETELRNQGENNQFVMYYQPVIQTVSEQVIGFEALVRWNLKGRVRSPAEFMEVAEESRCIIEIGRWVIQESIATLAKWQNLFSRQLSMAINLSSVQLTDKILISTIMDAVRTHNIEPRYIELEITETSLLNCTVGAIAVIEELHELGFKLALDDFGTGYSAIAHLQKFPIDILKIDKSIMVLDKSRDKKLVHGLVNMAKVLGMTTIAEGIESENQVKICREFQIDRMQGYNYGQPQSELEIEQRLTQTQNN